MSKNVRIERINADIMRVLSVAIRNMEKAAGVSIIAVDTSADLAWCNVMVDIAGDDETKQMQLRVLADAAGFLRKELSSNIKMRTTPQLRFILDKGRDNASRVEELLQQINSEGKK